MDKEVFDKINDMKSYVSVLFPNIIKKNCLDSASKYFMTHLEELEEILKERITE